MDERELIAYFLQQEKKGYAIAETAKEMLIKGVDRDLIDSVLDAFAAESKSNDPITDQAEESIAAMERRYERSLDKPRVQKQTNRWLRFIAGDAGRFGRAVGGILGQPPERASGALAFLTAVLAGAAFCVYWYLVFQPTLPHPFNTLDHPMDCAVTSSNIPPKGCH